MFPVSLSLRHRRRLVLRVALLALCIGLLLSGLYIYDQAPPPYKSERDLASETSTFSSSPDTKYVLFKQIRGAGFNNQLQEYILHHALARESGRAMVYQDMIWRYRGQDEVPLNALSRSLTEAPGIHETVFWKHCHGLDAVKNVTVPYGKLPWDSALHVLKDEQAKCIRVENWVFYWEYVFSTFFPTIY